MPSKPFDPTKPVTTRDGRPVRIICTDRDSRDGSIVALIKIDRENDPVHFEQCLSYYSDGKYVDHESVKDPWDLVNVPSVRFEYQNVYKQGQQAAMRSITRIAPAPRYMLGTNVYRFEDDKLVSVTFEPIKEN